MGLFKKSKEQRPKEDEKSPKSVDKGKSFLTPHVEILMNAARTGNYDTVLSLYSRRLDLTVADDDGNTAVHIAAMNDHVNICRMVIVLTAPKSVWKQKNKQGHTAVELAASEEIKADLNQLMNPGPRSEDVHTRFNDRLMADFDSWPENAKFLVALDGGGMKQLIMLNTLIHLDSLTPGGICDKMDWVAGTSSGGVLALQLGIGKSLEECRRFAIENRLKVFCGSKTKVPKHDAKGVETISQQFFGDARMSSIKKKKVMVTVSDTRKSPAALLIFRSYQPNISEKEREEYDYLDPDRILIWKAARCTTAAPYFFDSYNGLSDGGLVANNPSQALLTDFFLINKLENKQTDGTSSSKSSDVSPSRPSVGILLSMGTGILSTEKTDGIDVNLRHLTKKNLLQVARNLIGVVNNAKNALQLLVRECTSSGGQPARYCREWCHSLEIPYFRFSPRLTSDISMDSTDIIDLVDMLWDAEVYCQGEIRYELEQLAKVLAMKDVETKGKSKETAPREKKDTKPIEESESSTTSS